MEGQTPKIRTMARDLAMARGLPQHPQAPITKPAKRPEAITAQRTIPAQHHEQRRLSQILEEARGRMAAQETPRQAAITPPTPEPRRTLQDFLPIEPFDNAPGKPPVIHEPPSNLPTGEPSFFAPQPAEKLTLQDIHAGLPVRQAGLPADRQAGLPPTPRQDVPTSERDLAEEKTKRTPEEILGLPAEGLPKAGLPPAVKPAYPPINRQALPALPKAMPARRGRFRFVILTVFLTIVIIGLGYGIFWKVSSRETLPAPPSAPKITEHPIPEALITFRDTKIIEIKALEYDVLKSKLDALQTAELLPESLIYIPIKYSTQNEVRYLTLTEIFETLRIDAPPAIYGSKNFTLYLYSQGIEAEQLCREAGILAKSCFGPRLGIVIKLQPRDGELSKGQTTNIMGEWEKTIVNDARPLILAIPQVPDGYTSGIKFNVGKYREFDTHYLNLPIPTTSIDWILTDAHLIIATSKDAARAAVDALK